jgi:hypothetical protein
MQPERMPQDWAETEIKDVVIESPPPKSMVVKRKVAYDEGSISGWFRETVSPIYVPDRSDDKHTDSSAAMAEFQKHWDESATQARTTARWIATALGAALAALVGTAPLTGLSDDYIAWWAYGSAALGLVLVGVTLFLVLQVLVPGVTGFGDMMYDKDFAELRGKADRAKGVMLPTGIQSLAELGVRADLEARTLNALAMRIRELGPEEGTPPGKTSKTLRSLRRSDRSEGHTQESGNPAGELEALKWAQQARGHWLEVLTTEITQWTSVGAYEVVRKAAQSARTLGLLTGVAGTAAIILAFSLIHPKIEPATLHSYHLTSQPASDALTKAVKVLGPRCTDFKGVVTTVKDSDRQVEVLVEPSPACKGGLVTVPLANLKTTDGAKG